MACSDCQGQGCPQVRHGVCAHECAQAQHGTTHARQGCTAPPHARVCAQVVVRYHPSQSSTSRDAGCTSDQCLLICSQRGDQGALCSDQQACSVSECSCGMRPAAANATGSASPAGACEFSVSYADGSRTAGRLVSDVVALAEPVSGAALSSLSSLRSHPFRPVPVCSLRAGARVGWTLIFLPALCPIPLCDLPRRRTAASPPRRRRRPPPPPRRSRPPAAGPPPPPHRRPRPPGWCLAAAPRRPPAATPL